MSGRLYLALRHAQRRPARSAILVACLALVLTIPVVSRVLAARFERTLHKRADAVPMIVGAAGSRFDLVFAALYYRSTPIGTMKMRDYRALLDDQTVQVFPIHARFTAQGAPVVATSIEFFELQGLHLDEGRMFVALGEAVVGAETARRLSLSPGDTLDTDQLKQYDITAPPSIRLHIAGVLAPAHSPDDAAVFIDLETAWVLEGAAHGHADAQTIERPDLLIGKTDEHVALSEAVVTIQEITPENVGTFHIHGSRDDLPLTAVLVYPASEKASTILAARYNDTPGLQALSPSRVVEELIDYVVQIRRLLDVVAVVLAASTIALIALIVALAVRVRADEVRTLSEIGADRSAVFAIFAWELGALALGALLAAGVLSAVVVTIISAVAPLL
ncbi:MAG: ABC transporter permease [Phycisphaerales bacterium]